MGRPVPEETLTHSHPSWSSGILINFLHLLRSIASSLFSLRAWQSFLTSRVNWTKRMLWIVVNAYYYCGIPGYTTHTTIQKSAQNLPSAQMFPKENSLPQGPTLQTLGSYHFYVDFCFQFHTFLLFLLIFGSMQRIKPVYAHFQAR